MAGLLACGSSLQAAFPDIIQWHLAFRSPLTVAGAAAVSGYPSPHSLSIPVIGEPSLSFKFAQSAYKRQTYIPTPVSRPVDLAALSIREENKNGPRIAFGVLKHREVARIL
jgi:hypothetical protein